MADLVTLSRSLRIEWKVKNILQLNSLDTEDLSFDGSTFKFLLRKIGMGETESISIIISRTNSKYAPLNVITVHVFIEGRNRKPHFPNKITDTCGFSLLWKEYVSTLREKGESILKDGVVTFVCLFPDQTTSEDKIETDISAQTAANVESLANLERLSFDFDRLLDDGHLSDVTLKCGDRAIPAHKSILCARSEVFLAMLRSDMAEGRTGIIEISDMEPSTLGQLVQYIYSGKVSNLSADSAQVLYAAADKYGVDSLKEICGNFMKENLTEENACNFLALADLHGDNDMKDSVLAFIIKTELLQDEDRWLKFLKEHPGLATEVIHHAYKAKCSPK